MLLTYDYTSKCLEHEISNFNHTRSQDSSEENFNENEHNLDSEIPCTQDPSQENPAVNGSMKFSS